MTTGATALHRGALQKAYGMELLCGAWLYIYIYIYIHLRPHSLVPIDRGSKCIHCLHRPNTLLWSLTYQLPNPLQLWVLHIEGIHGTGFDSPSRQAWLRLPSFRGRSNDHAARSWWLLLKIANVNRRTGKSVCLNWRCVNSFHLRADGHFCITLRVNKWIDLQDC